MVNLIANKIGLMIEKSTKKKKIKKLSYSNYRFVQPTRLDYSIGSTITYFFLLPYFLLYDETVNARFISS